MNMKDSIIKFRYAIIALVMMAVNGAVAYATAPWTVNPGDYRYDMSLYFDVEFATEPMDYSHYEIGVFCGEECRGIAEILDLGNGSVCLYSRVRSNEESGETMTFKYYEIATGETRGIDGESFQFESNGMLGYPSAPYVVKITRHYYVTIEAGVGGTTSLESGSYAEDTELVIDATPDEGYHFVQWSDGSVENPRTILVNEDISLAAEFGVNSYKLTYNVDGEEYKALDIDFGSAIIAEAAPEKEGYTFSGWEGLPESMPAHDVTVAGTFSINSYNAVFKVGEDVIETKIVVFGQAIVAPEAPEKEGYTFAGWQDIPESMPAHDVEIPGSYTVNKYKLTVYLNEEVYSSESIEFGSTLNIEDPEVPDGCKFDGWTEEIPSTMPAYDLDIHGTYSTISSVMSITVDDREVVNVYTINGNLIYAARIWNDIHGSLSNGLYIVNGRKVMVDKR